MRRKGRKIDGILLLDKPPGLTSNAALQQTKRLFQAAKAGHTGSLDPLATGVLPLCFGEATKFSQFLLDANKRYLTKIRLGVATETGDADGTVVTEKPVPVLGGEELEACLDGFRGEIDQIPSMYSALKHNGEPLYKLARQGIEVERKSRKVTIFHLNLIEQGDDFLVLDISCTKGTYVRTIAEDIGKELGCGAHVEELRRLQSGPFKIEETVTFEELEALVESEGTDGLDKMLLPVSTAVSDWPAVALPEVAASYLRQGQPVLVAKAPTSGWVRIFSESDNDENEFLGIGEILDDGRVAPRKLVAL